MKIVIISRIIYPLLSPRAFRSTELAKEFARLGHEVSLYGVLGDYDYTEFCINTGVKVKSIKTHFATSNSDGKVRYTLLDKIAYHALGGIIEYPDIEFCWTIPRILNKEIGIDLLITIAMPFPIHWGAAIAKRLLGKRFPKVWISDCGDPYMGNKMGRKHLFYFKWVELFWGSQTDYVTLPVESARQAYYPNIQNKIRIIPQGFEMENIELDEYTRNDIPHFAYAGSIYVGKRDPTLFLEYLCTLSTDFVFTIFTNTPNFYDKFKERLGHKLRIRSYIPRTELLKELCRQDFLINLINISSTQSPSKLIDYILSRRPILNISTPFTEKEKIDNALKGIVISDIENINISNYDIKNVAASFLKLCDTDK